MVKSELQQLQEIRKDNEFLKESYDMLRRKYSNQYIAIKNRNIIAHDRDIKKVMKLVSEKNINPADVLIEFLHPKDMILIL
ncbi:MAG: hypothetical protein DRN24_00935 [Thermoplasmata archaeon]|nr:MAG: hypothetical protein DRN24_00935 [Thermoplasmata archaeon]